MADYYVISCHVLWRELCYYASLSRNVHTLHLLKQGLHETPDLLRDTLQQAIDAVDGDYSAILIGYGLCSNGLAGIVARDTRLVCVRGHDCITFLLGSKERYREYFDNRPGTYWYTPGWIDTSLQPGQERYEKTLQAYAERYGQDNAEYLMSMEQNWFQEYSNAAYVDLGFSDTANYKEYTVECARWLGWNYDELRGDPQLIIDFLEGNWDSERFLIVEPGETITASHDERVLDTAKPA